MALGEELERAAGAAQTFAEPGEAVALVLVTEPAAGERIYLCAYDGEAGRRSWLAFDAGGHPVRKRKLVREAVSIAALCEVAEETAGGGDLSELRAQLVSLRLTEDPPGLDEAEEAALALEHAVRAPPRVASPAYLDAVGVATARLERALGNGLDSPFAAAMRGAAQAVGELTEEVERDYKGPLD